MHGAENAIHSWKNGALVADELRMVDYTIDREVLYSFPMSTNVTTNVTRLETFSQFYKHRTSS